MITLPLLLRCAHAFVAAMIIKASLLLGCLKLAFATKYLETRGSNRLSSRENGIMSDYCGESLRPLTVFKVACNNGHTACSVEDIRKSPWAVRIGRHCTGTLISNRHVLTAAHCIYHVTDKFQEDCMKGLRRFHLINKAAAALYKGPMFVYAGHNNYSCPSGSSDCYADASKFKINVKNVMIHPRWCTGSRFDGDIAVLELDANDVESRLINFNWFSNASVPRTIYPICVPSSNFTLINTGHISAFGRNAFSVERKNGSKDLTDLNTRELFKEFKNDDNGVLRSTVLPVRTYSVNSASRTFNTIARDTDACKGDSGGGVTQNQRSEPRRKYVVGVISFGSSCVISSNKHVPTNRNHQTVVSDVRMYAEWICYVSGVCVPGATPKSS